VDKAEPFANLPERLGGLGKLAYNLWWSWHPAARNLFRVLDLQAWRESKHNPVQILALLSPRVLASAAQDKEFLARYDAVMAQFEAETISDSGWFAGAYGRTGSPLAFFSAEYGLHVSLPIYAGGLGILAGDYLKECSDLAVPVIGVGVIYSQGYVHQRIREDGWQEDVEETLDRTDQRGASGPGHP
jgi:starch phosphorylase